VNTPSRIRCSTLPLAVGVILRSAYRDTRPERDWLTKVITIAARSGVDSRDCVKGGFRGCGSSEHGSAGAAQRSGKFQSRRVPSLHKGDAN
jgi:hypothetical protein